MANAMVWSTTQHRDRDLPPPLLPSTTELSAHLPSLVLFLIGDRGQASLLLPPQDSEYGTNGWGPLPVASHTMACEEGRLPICSLSSLIPGEDLTGRPINVPLGDR